MRGLGAIPALFYFGANEMSDDLKKVLPGKRTVHVAGEDVEIKLIKVGKLSQVVEAIQPIAYLMPTAGAKPDKEPMDFKTIVIKHTADAIHLTALLTDKPSSWVEELNVAELITLLSAIAEENIDFFIESVLPLLSEVTGKLASAFYGVVKKSAENGQSLSNG